VKGICATAEIVATADKSFAGSKDTSNLQTADVTRPLADAFLTPEQEGKDTELSTPHHSKLFNSLEILSVDDNAVNHVVVENSLAPKGYKITVCMNGVEALKLLEDRGYLPDLILLVS